MATTMTQNDGNSSHYSLGQVVNQDFFGSGGKSRLLCEKKAGEKVGLYNTEKNWQKEEEDKTEFLVIFKAWPSTCNDNIYVKFKYRNIQSITHHNLLVPQRYLKK